MSSTSPQGIRWLSLEPGSGLGDASEAYLSGLRAAGVPVSWTPLGWPSPVWGAPFGPALDVDLDGAVHRDLVGEEIGHDTVVVFSTPLWHPQLRVEAEGRLLVAYTTWEADLLPEASVSVVNRYDRVLVPSRFNAAVFEASGVTTPIEVVPHIARAPAPAHAVREGPFTFYTIATWTTRKAILDVVAAYLAAFNADDDVLLVIHTTPVDLIAYQRAIEEAFAGGEQPPPDSRCATAQTLAKSLAGHERAPEVRLSTRRLSRSQIEALHASCDCFVSLSRGEGWGLGPFDAAAFGNPVIVPGWGGTLDFLPAGYPYCVEYDLVPTVTEPSDYWWRPNTGARWAKARIDHAALLLRRVFENRKEAGHWGRILKRSVTASFSEPSVTARLLEALGT